MVRACLFISVGFAPLVVLMHYALDLDETVEFVLSAAALIPLAWLIGEATEHAAEHTGPGIGGFLNATFGNAPELIIALLAVNEGLNEVVRGSLTGSVIGNLLLVLGFSLFFGGRGEIDRRSSFIALGLVGATTLILLIPSVPGWDGDPDSDSLVALSIPIAIVLLCAYVALTWYSLRRHAAMHVSSDEEIESWSLRLALVVLAGATVITALVAEILVGTLKVFSHQVGPVGVLRLRGDRRDRRQRRRARRRRRRRRPRQDQARRRDRAGLERAGRRLPDPGRDAAGALDQPVRALVPPGRARRPRLLDHRHVGPARRRPLEQTKGTILIVAYVAVATAFYIAGDR